VSASDLVPTIAARVATIRRGVARACERSGRDPNAVRIVAAAKTVDPSAIAAARDAGVRDVGENYVSELRSKAAAVDGVTWHFIGTLQSGSAHRVAELADVVHCVVPGHAAQRLARRAASAGRTIPVMIEVDFAGRGTGVPADGAAEAADRLTALEGVELVGLMTLPPMPEVAEDARPYFARLRDLLGRLSEGHPGMRELSMGMSLDYEVAVEEGATMVRVGSALFGARSDVDTGRT
jgi:pyridoxal phosphate enzyme (YggS family)